MKIENARSKEKCVMNEKEEMQEIDLKIKENLVRGMLGFLGKDKTSFIQMNEIFSKKELLELLWTYYERWRDCYACQSTAARQQEVEEHNAKILAELKKQH